MNGCKSFRKAVQPFFCKRKRSQGESGKENVSKFTCKKYGTD